jgi:hypothetical protein
MLFLVRTLLVLLSVNMGGGVSTSPTLTDCLWFLCTALGVVRGTQRIPNCKRCFLLSDWCNFGGIPLAVEIPCSWVELANGSPDSHFPHSARAQGVGAGGENLYVVAPPQYVLLRLLTLSLRGVSSRLCGSCEC